MEHAGDGHHGAGRILGALDDDGAAGAHGRGDLADGLVVGKVPGREGGAHADGFAQHHLAHVGQARRDHAAVDAPALLGVPFAVLGARHHLADRLGQRLAHVEHDVAADLLGPLAGELGHLAQDAAALQGRALLPALEGALRGGQRAVEVFTGGVRQPGDHLAGGRIDDVLLAAAAALDEFAVDVEAQRRPARGGWRCSWEVSSRCDGPAAGTAATQRRRYRQSGGRAMPATKHGLFRPWDRMGYTCPS